MQVSTATSSLAVGRLNGSTSKHLQKPSAQPAGLIRHVLEDAASVLNSSPGD